MKVSVSLRGTQRADGESETIALTAEGILSFGDGQWVLSYSERDEEGDERFTTLRCTGREAQVERSGGGTQSLMTIQPGRRCTCAYDTPYGAITMTVTAHALHDRVTPDGGTLDMAYSLDFGSGAPIDNTLHLTVRKIEE